MNHLVLGTAGHVDHGKTALIKALTGTDTDRLKEEKQRGITIELGFTSLTLPSGHTLGIVDVPGHEKFVKTMVAGASGIDLVMMVIAADEGIMPQTREHLQICSLLGISRGIIALTKIDLVEQEWLELVQTEIKAFFKNTFLQDAPIVPVSAVTEQGLPELVEAIHTTVNSITDKTDDGIFRLPIDRVFTIKGFGTVVTGTIVSGQIAKGEEIQILPLNITARIRGLQVHNQSVEDAWKGQRTAMNLQGVEKSSIERGNIIARPQTIWPSQRLDVFLEFLASNPKSIKNRTLVRLHTGTNEIIARLILLEQDELAPGQTGWAQLVVSDQAAVVAHDRFVLRSYSPVTTIGGGRIIDPLPAKHKRMNQKVIEELNTLKEGTLTEKISIMLERCGYKGANPRFLAFRLGIRREKVEEIINLFLADEKAFLLDGEDTTVISSIFFSQLEALIVRHLDQYHKKNPLREGMPKEELKASLEKLATPKLFNMVLNSLAKKETIVSDRDSLRLFRHKVDISGDLDAMRQEIAGIYQQAGLAPPSLADVLNRFQDKKKAQNIISLMIKEGRLVKINEDLCFSKDNIEKLKDDYTRLLMKDGKSTPATFKALTGLSRKYIIPLMEYFDMAKLTVRVGDHRVLRKPS
jgi:selenocysteine-specific elongation factor